MNKFIVQGIRSPMRLDRYLRTIDPLMTQGFIEKALRNGDIKLHDAKALSSNRVNDGDTILINDRISVSSTQALGIKNFSSSVIALADKLLGQYLIQDEAEFFVINKPSDLATQGGSNIKLSVDHALQYLNTRGYDFRLVHRLDKDTTGVLLIAKNRYSATLLGSGFKNRIIYKKYLAVLGGIPRTTSGRIESYLTKDQGRVYEVDAGHNEAKLAVTDYSIIKTNGRLSLVEFIPHTGRMHQIRCHAAFSLKTPIIGDERYGSKHTTDSFCLHASEIVLPLEVFGEEYRILAPLPTKYEQLVS
jgi:23S rRNA pseudouridine955/2504/2580 synthase